MNLCIRVGVLLAKNKDGHMRRPLANSKFIKENTKIKNLRILAPFAKIFPSTIFFERVCLAQIPNQGPAFDLTRFKFYEDDNKIKRVFLSLQEKIYYSALNAREWEDRHSLRQGFYGAITKYQRIFSDKWHLGYLGNEGEKRGRHRPFSPLTQDELKTDLEEVGVYLKKRRLMGKNVNLTTAYLRKAIITRCMSRLPHWMVKFISRNSEETMNTSYVFTRNL